MMGLFGENIIPFGKIDLDKDGLHGKDAESENKKRQKVIEQTKKEISEWRQNHDDNEQVPDHLALAIHCKELLPIYPVFMKFPIKKAIQAKERTLPSVVIDNKTFFHLCLDETTNKTPFSGSLVARWNKTVLEYYRGFTVDTYEEYQQPFRNWFELDQKIVMDSSEYNAIPLLYDGLVEKPPNKWYKYPNRLTYTQNKYIEYSDLVKEYINVNGGGISTALKLVFNEFKKTKFKYVGVQYKGWRNSTLNSIYYKGLNLKRDGYEGIKL